ncbi:MAG: glycosyltransferase family 4 protein [Candidatus Methanoplasma sp.]|nr:glycosyltransferase family 4 protein [Candidatus Methanoplasma sp.]
MNLKIQLLRNEKEEDRRKTGVGAYADMMETFLKDRGVECETISFEVSFRGGIRNLLRNSVTDPVRKIIAGRKDTDIVHVTFEYCSFYIPLTKAKKVVTFHHVVNHNEGNTKKWYLTWRLSAWIAVVFSDKIIAISSQTKNEIIEKYNISPDKIEVITWVPVHFDARSDIQKEHLVGCMGSLSERKNFAAAIRVFNSILKDADLSDYKMTICGKGPMREMLVEQARTLNIEEKVSFREDLSREEMVRFYNSCSILLNTSSHEGLGLATVEAQMCGTPVLYFKDAQIPKEVMVAAVPCIDENEMSEKAKTILKDEQYRDKLKYEGLEFVNKLGNDFEKNVLGVYKHLLEKK